MAVCSCRHSVQAAAELGMKNIRRVFGVKENRNVSAKQNTQQSFVRERETENGEENFPLRGWQWRICRCVGAGGAVVVLLFASSEKKRRRTV